MHRAVASFVLLILLLLYPHPAIAQPVSDVLITTDIGTYKASKRPTSGQGSGILAGARHFRFDHTDTTYRISYFDVSTEVGVEVQITLHTSTQWLGHEVEDGYHSSSDERLGLLTEGTVMRQIDGQNVFWLGLGGGSFKWLSSGNVVVYIKYVDLQGVKPEPLEIVRAYLAKYPSSITMTDAELKSPSHTESWLKDEMGRRLWLMEKWVGVGSADVLKQAEAMRTILSHVEVFAKYRQKYLGEDPKDLMIAFYTAAGGGGGAITPENWTKLTAEVGKLRTWWDGNKTRPLTISGLPSGFRLASGWPVLLGGLGAARQLWVERGRVSGLLRRAVNR